MIFFFLPLHLTELLEPLDVGVFGILKQNYKKFLSKNTCFTTYDIDRTDFISLIQKIDGKILLFKI